MNRLAATACGIGFAGVALGAFGAHGLGDALTSEARGWWDTATLYALVHSVAALSAGLSGRAGLVRLGGWCFLLGALVFAGTLYAMALGAPRWLGAVTPTGGLTLLAGWALAGLGAVRAGNQEMPRSDAE